MGFQFALTASLGKAQAWLLGEDEVTELEKLVMGEERETVKQWRRKFPIEVSISAWFDGSVQASIQQYATQNVPNMGLLSRASVSSDVWQLQSFNARG